MALSLHRIRSNTCRW
jgi:hypothetical protein